MAAKSITLKCLEVTQPIGTFYVGVAKAQDVLEIAYTDIRRIEERDIEKVVGIQRELVPRRVQELKEYVKGIDATFPTGVILAIDSNNARFDEVSGELTVKRSPEIAKVIDGQHRIAGLEGFQGQFDLNVTIFIDMELQDQAMTFATINLAQTRVSKSLVYDLFEFQSSRSPQKSCHNIARLLNREKGSPLWGRIKILGKATGEPYQNLTQAAFVEALMQHVSKAPAQDRDILKRGKRVPSDETESRLIFRKFFRTERDEEIVAVLWTFFEVVANRWEAAWNSTAPGIILNRTSGFHALMRFLGDVYRALADKDGRLPRKALERVLAQSKLKDNDFNRDKYVPGGSGTKALYLDLLSCLKDK